MKKRKSLAKKQKPQARVYKDIKSWKIKVRKRNELFEKFNQEKITQSIFKAAQRVGGKDRKLAFQLAQKVTLYLKENFPRKRIFSSDEIGNAVEKVLIENGHARTAKTYILYREGQRKARNKLVKIRDLPKLRDFLRLTDRKTVFVTGVYDVVHIGHLRYLKKASLQGDVLVLGLNSDQSARKLKGKDRPIFGEEMRAELLSYVDFIDYIVVYPWTHGAKIIEVLRPNVYVCVEGSWQEKFEDKPEAKAAKKCKSKIVVLPPQSLAVSTTKVIRKIKENADWF